MSARQGACVRIARVTEEQDLRRLFAFRYRIYVEELGWLPASCETDLPSEVRVEDGLPLLTDEYDEAAANYAAFDEADEVVGSVRVIADGPLGLPLERCSPLDGYRRGKRLAEICRLAVCRDMRCTRLASLLMKAGWQCADDLGATHVVMDTYIDERRKTHELYLWMGFKALGDPHPDPNYEWSLPVVPLGLDCSAAERDWQSTRPTLLAFFASADPCIDHGCKT